MKTRILALLLTLALCLPLLVGCHGARRMDPFEIPETFDTTREHTITFWAKSDTNVKQTRIYRNRDSINHNVCNVEHPIRLPSGFLNYKACRSTSEGGNYHE